MLIKEKSKFRRGILAIAISGLSLASTATYAGYDHDDDDDDDDRHHKKSYTLTGACSHLPASRATEFHGNANNSDLNLGMAGNQWVVFDHVMQGFNVSRGISPTGIPSHLPNGSYTLADLNEKARQYYIQLIPPGQIRDQIKSGCMILGNEDDRNFLPGSVQVDFDIFASTNYTLMQDLANNGFVSEAIPYIKNKLDLMVDADNSQGIGTAGAPGSYENTQDILMDLLDSSIVVSEVDHINEGVHKAINKMYQAMDEYVRENGPTSDIAALDSALAAVATPQAGSPAALRTGVSTNFDLATNANCHYTGHATIADGTLKFCEFAILNKSNTHETRVHHVETPAKILDGTAHVGPVWTSELKFAQAAGDAVSGMDQVGGSGGVSSPAAASPAVNAPATYSIAVVATAENAKRAKQFINYVRSPDGQSKYTDGGFIGLTAAEMDAGQCYAADGTMTPRTGGCNDDD